MIFIATGSRSFQFNRLLKVIDEAIGEGKIKEPVFAQIGASDYKANNYEFIQFLNYEEFNEKLNSCDVVITHGGTGVIINAVKLGKRVIAVPRLAKHGEAVDDHQIQLIKAFEKMEMVTPCYECTSDEIVKALDIAKKAEVKPYISNTQNIINSIECMVQSELIKNNSNNKMRILMCSSARSEKGGMNSVIDLLMDHTWDERFEFSYLATHISGNPIKKILFFIKAYVVLKKLIYKNTFDIIHIHMSYKGSFYRKYLVSNLCKKNGKKVIIHLHGSEFEDFYNTATLKLQNKIRKLFSEVDCTIVLGNKWRNFIKRISPEANIVVINNAINILPFKIKKYHTPKRLLFLGALIKRKGVIDLLHAIKILHEDGIKNFQLLIAGSGDEEKKLKEYVNENKLFDIVSFLGWVTSSQKMDLLQNSDILVLPSYNEGLPMAILEAMSFGMPIISTNVGSISEAVHDNENGFLFCPGEIDELVSVLKKILLDEKIWDKFSQTSRKIVEEKFSEDVFFDKIQKVYINLWNDTSI